jgi:hypothetical protein
MPDNTTFVTVPVAAPAIKTGSYLQHNGAVLGVYQQLATRSGGEVLSSDSY